MGRYLYLPIEIGSRDLAPRLLIAAAAVERGYEVLIGLQRMVYENAANLPPGVYLSKGTNNLFLYYVPKIWEAGHAFVSMEEENFGFALEKGPLNFNSSALGKLSDLYLCIGRDEASFIERRYGPDFRKVLTGNARVDLLRPQLRPLYNRAVRNIKKQHGKFILLNLNFGLINPADKATPDQLLLRWIQGGIFKDTDSDEEKARGFEEFVKWESANLRAVTALLPLLAQRDYRVIVRPHPSELAKTWEDAIQRLNAPNVKVVSDGPLIPFLLGSELVVHPGCTTGMEALIAGVPTLSLMIGDSPVNDYYLSNKVNVTARTPEQAVAIIDQHMKGEDVVTGRRDEMMSILDNYIEDVSKDVLTADRIVAAIEPLSASRKASATALMDAKWDNISVTDYHRYKFRVNEAMVKDLLSGFCTTLQRFHDVRTKEVHDSVYLVSGKRPRGP